MAIEIFFMTKSPQKNVPDVGSNLGPLAFQADMLPIKLPRPAVAVFAHRCGIYGFLKRMKYYKHVLMDGLRFYVPSTVFQSFRDDGRMNMKGSVQ